MVNFTNFQRIATATVGALVLSTACLAAATGPGLAVETSTTSYAAAQVSTSGQANA